MLGASQLLCLVQKIQPGETATKQNCKITLGVQACMFLKKKLNNEENICCTLKSSALKLPTKSICRHTSFCNLKKSLYYKVPTGTSS